MSQAYLMNNSGIYQAYLRYILDIYQVYLRHLSDIVPFAPSIMMPQPKKTCILLARRKYADTIDLLAKTRFMDENENILASINRNIIHKTRERKFEFAFNKLHEVLNKLEEKGVERELVSSIRN